MVAAAEGKVAFIFPGQASQRAGMAVELLSGHPTARDMFRQAGEILGLDLAGLCTTGDDALLTRTDIAQPALLTTCLAWLTLIREHGIRPQLVAGHSLGEFSAWVAAGVLEFAEAVRLVRRRGELMEEASRRRPGGMLAVLGLTDAQVKEMCERAGSAGVVAAVNFNCPGQVVVSGEASALEAVAGAVKAARGKAMALRVSGAFHSPLMEDAAHAFAGLVESLVLRDPTVPVVANATADLVVRAEDARKVMTSQMTNPVLWTDSVRRMISEGVRTFVEVGPGNVLTKLVERISAEARAIPVGTLQQLRTLVEEVRP